MIRSLEQSDEVSNAFVVCDIENMPDGSIISIDTAWRNENGDIVHKTVQDWEAWWTWIVRLAKHDPKFRMVFAHNGGGWDWLSLVEYLNSDGKKRRQSMTIISASSKMIMLRVSIEHRFTLCFCDSYELLRSSLDKLAKILTGKGKVDIGGKLPHQILAENPKLFWQYVKEDTERLLEVLEKSLDLIRGSIVKIDSFGPTVGSTAMKVFKTLGLPKDISTPIDSDVKAFLRSGYVGGRVECFRPGYFPHVNVYDINSLYPFAMATTEVPTTADGFWSTYFDSERCGVYDVSFEQVNRNIPAVLMVHGKGVYNGEGIYFTPELNLLRSIDRNATFRVKHGYVFLEQGLLFSKYVEKLYGLRLENPDSPISMLAKYLLNSLYGKFAQRPEKKQIICIDEFVSLYDMVANGSRVTPLSESKDIYTVSLDSPSSFEHVGIAGMITSAARVALYRGLYGAGKSLIYCDTDSVHCTSKLDSGQVGKALGAYKIEESNCEGIYLGKKLYALRRKDATEKVTVKGVRIGGNLGSQFGFDDMLQVFRGENAKLTFQTSPTILEVLRGKRRACSFAPKIRTIKRTA